MYLFPVILAVLEGSLTVEDPGGSPVPGAAVCTDTTLIGVTDASGSLEVPSGTDWVSVSSVGYRSWTGSISGSETIVLEPVPVPSGMVVTVSGSRSQFRRDFPSTTILGREEMEFMGRSGLGSVSGLSSGIYAREYGGSMPVISISVRGSAPAHCEYYVDGHSITGPMDGLPGTTLDPLLFDAMEISRGGGSAYSKGGMAGTLNFIPVSLSGPAEYGLHAGDDGSASIFGSVPLPSSRLTVSLRRNTGETGSVGHSGSLLTTGRLSGLSYGLLAGISAGETENPDWAPTSDGFRKRASLDAWSRYSLGECMVSAGLRVGRHSYRSSVPDIIDDTHDETGADLGFNAGTAIWKLETELSGQVLYDRVSSTALGDRNRSTFRTSIRTGYRGAVVLSGALSLNATTGCRTLSGASISMGIPFSDSALTVHATLSKGFRRPTLNDLYWPEDAFAVGNPDLSAETSTEMEVGVSAGVSGFIRASLNFFQGRSDNLIRWETGTGGIWMPVNVARALRRGLEGELWTELGPVVLAGNVTLLEVTDDSPESVNNGRILPYTPDYTYSVHSALRVPEWISWSVTIRGMGLRFMNYSETSWMPAYTVLSAGISAAPRMISPISLDLSADNLTDEEYQETSGFTGKGRTFYFGISWN